MKKKIILLVLMMVAVFSLSAKEKERKEPSRQRTKQESRFDLYLGGSILYENPIIAGGKFNQDFIAKDKPINIDDFLFGLKLRTDWTWGKVGIRLDLDSLYNPTADYLALGEALMGSVMNLDFGEFLEIEHGMKFVFNPMFQTKGKFLSFSFGPGVVFGWNVSQGVGAIKAIKGDPDHSIDHYLERIGITGDGSITTQEDLKENLTWLQQTAYYGGQLDFNVKVGLDFFIGKMLFGINYVWDMNSKVSAWDKDKGFIENMDAAFKMSETVGYLGGYFLIRL